MNLRFIHYGDAVQHKFLQRSYHARALVHRHEHDNVVPAIAVFAENFDEHGCSLVRVCSKESS
ncbi:hypothetical protein U27_03074 [Candidatus Vecturithrix granuli]|uniref:Uncharacterized protein n=1 Tax=Vecturithrix granuli TaxID=1499967 RepID=A0A081BUV7_VECG1|nr:hypothetical protein U27_03074 [Candidatus Vecturithrix granuli]